MFRAGIDILESNSSEELEIELQIYKRARSLSDAAKITYATYADYETKRIVFVATIFMEAKPLL